jgi:hypothetical protein
VLGTVVTVEREGHLEFVARLGSEPCDENFMQALEGVVLAFQPSDTFFHGKTRTLGVRKRAKARERG